MAYPYLALRPTGNGLVSHYVVAGSRNPTTSVVWSVNVISPKMVGIKQFPIKDGRYIVLLFKADKFTGEVVSSDEGEMEWVDCDRLDEVNTVEDFHDLLKVINDPELTEFQYVIEDDRWITILK